MQELFGLALLAGLLVPLALLVALLGYGLGRRHARSAPEPAPSGTPGGTSQAKDKTSSLYAIANELEPMIQQAARPEDVLDDPTFVRGVRFLAAKLWSREELLGYYRGESVVCACLALEALRVRARTQGDPGHVVRDTILDSLNDYVTWNRYFALRTLGVIVPAPGKLGGSVLVRLDDSWLWTAPNLRVLENFLRDRVREGEPIGFDEVGVELAKADAEQLETLTNVLKKLPADLGRPLIQQLDGWKDERIDRHFLESVGRIWDAAQEERRSPIIEHEGEGAAQKKLESTLLDQSGRSVILVGEHGVGKTTLVRGLTSRLMKRGVTLFEAGASEVLAGQIYLGQLEERVRELFSRLRDRPIVWFVPDIHTLRMAGRHQHSTTSVMDMLLPAVESGSIVVIGETTPAAYQQLLLEKPRVRTAFEALRVSPLSEAATRALVQRWAVNTMGGEDGLPEETQREALLLAQQYLTDHAAPGNVLKLLDDTRTRLLAANPDGSVRIESDDLITSLSQLTGLPASILDDRQGLDLEDLHEFFERRVMGQPEAVDCIVDRVSMIKAGVTDPSRPFGVFLFAGPTGTGKTEIAKTLAEYLFGSARRLIRLDMSEFQTPESLDRLIGGADQDRRGGALVDLIRKQPFSVILLDEFEKAHDKVWDLFLQLFDDGRLTDREGNTSDFRNAIVILTSNLGSHLPAGAAVGFTDKTGTFSVASVQRAIEGSFRKEFLNRLDRVVVFRPLGRETMREILLKELGAAFRRRGLRNREWAVEWDSSAIEFLLERGFTLDLGARPLRRAIERYLLTPLSQTIVNHQYPEGDQFLFVRAEKDRLVVDFIDPDAGEDPPEASPSDDTLSPVVLERVGLNPRGEPGELALLEQTYRDLEEISRGDAWQRIKREGLEKMATPGFWDRPDRFLTLGDIEYVDRLEASLRSARSLLDRLSGRQGPVPRKLLGRLASQLFVLREAVRGVLEGEPREAFLSVEAWSDAHRPSRYSRELVPRIVAMYEAWAHKRAMPFERLADHEGGTGGRGMLLSISGYSAYTLLRPEHGLHVWEVPVEDRQPKRATVRVRVAPQPATPAGSPTELLEMARQAIAQDHGGTPSIVRRYQESPSPLVRDSASGWRSGLLDRVLGGDFDLLGRALTSVDE